MSIIANTTYLDEDCSDISDWTDDDAGSGASTQIAFDSKSCFEHLTGSTDYSRARRYRDVGSFGNRVVVSLSVYHDLIGNLATYNVFSLEIDTAGVSFIAKFATDGLFIWDGATNNEVGTNLVVQDVWQQWTFDIDFDNMLVDVYLTDAGHTDELVGENIDCSNTGSFTNGLVALNQACGTSNNQLSYVDWVKVGDGFYDYTLSISDGTHSHSADAITLIKNHFLSIADALHSHSADSPTLETVNLVLSIADALHSHTADSIDIELEISPGIWTPLSVLPNDITSVSFLDVEEGGMYDFRIRYRGQDGRVGPWVEYNAYTVIGKSTAPAAPTSLSATQIELAIKLAWTNPTVPDFAYTGIWRAEADVFPGGDPDFVVSGGPGEKMEYVDEGITIGTTYYYWFKSYDTAGNASAQTASVNSSAVGVSAAHIEAGTLKAGSWIKVGNNVEINADDECYRVFSSAVTISSAVNDYLDWTQNGTVFAATLAGGNYTPAQLSTYIQTRMWAVGSTVTIVNYNSTTRKISISNSAVGLNFLWQSGTNAAYTCGEALGFNIAADDTGATAYTADYPCCLRCVLGKL